MKERGFRTTHVIPFLKALKYCVAFPIQQVAIVGDPDFILCLNGKFVALELKAPWGRLSAVQEYKLDLVKRLGGIAIVASPRNWEQVKFQLRQLDQGEEI